MSTVTLSDAADRVLVYLYEASQMTDEQTASGNDVYVALPDLPEAEIDDAIAELIEHGFIGRVGT